MDEMLINLQKIGFTKLESEIYLDLLKNSGLTGYQIAKNLNISRSSVYPTLDAMYKKGYILLVQGDAQTYVAEDSEVLINRLKRDFKTSADSLDAQLKSIKVGNIEERFVNISGFDQMITKTKELMRQAQKEVIMNINGGISYLRDEIIALRKRNGRVVIFSFMDLDVKGLDVEFYTHKMVSRNDLSRIMIVVDYKQTLVADIYDERPIWLGVLTNNPLMTSIVNEHIHHDIYLLLFEEKNGTSLFDNHKLDTLMEKERNVKKCGL